MKNFKKWIILVLLIVGILVYFVYQNLNNSTYEDIKFENFIAQNEEKTFQEIKEEFIVLHITGEVNNPGVIKIKQNSRVIDAIEAAGGLTEEANVDKINLAYILSDGQKIYIPSINDKEVEEYVTENSGTNIVVDDFNFKQKTKVNINTATQTELETVTGIGPSTALKIINYRKENGKFKNIEEIKNISGIGEAKYNAIKGQICV